MKGPNFICIGAQKAGTGWLYEQLRAHPDFWMPPIKELHYFDRQFRTARPAAGDRFDQALKEARDERDEAFVAGAKSLFAEPGLNFDGYADLFLHRGQLISGDITPGYSVLSEDSASMVTGAFPQAQILFLARDPVERAWSQISMWIRHQRIARFDSTDPEMVLDILREPGIAARSYPSQIVRRWKQNGPGRFHLFFFDDLKSDPGGLRGSILDVLGADAAKASGDLSAAHNAKARLEKLPLTDDVREEVARYFKEELQACATELGGPATAWPARYGFQ